MGKRTDVDAGYEYGQFLIVRHEDVTGTFDMMFHLLGEVSFPNTSANELR